MSISRARTRLDWAVITEREAIDKLRTTFSTIDEHRARWADPSLVAPEGGSPLAADDRTWPSLSLSQLAHQGIVCAWDHFDLARFTIEGQRGFPTAIYSVLRGGLLASSQALWALGPEDAATRRDRGLMLADEWYRRRIEWQESLTTRGQQGGIFVAADVLTAEDAGRSVKQLQRLEDDRARAKALRTTTGRLVATTCVREAGEIVAKRTGNPSVKTSAPREWQRLGGDVHGLGWPLMMQNAVWGERGTDGLTAATVTVDLVTMANSYLCAWMVYVSAVQRLDDLRRTVPAAEN